MCWHRRPVQPGPIHSSQTLQNSTFASCAQATGYRNIVTNSAHCEQCYSKFDIKVHSLYEKQFSHYTINGIGHRQLRCTTCSKSLIELRPLRNCIPCMTKLTDYITRRIERGQSLDTYTIIHTFERYY